jgi:oligoribonuclease NrnB/cAMP/cGMP phosphodiesterase (DHH superfamily)
MSKQKFNHIIYHKGCLDGFCGFFIAHMSGQLSRDVVIFEDMPSTQRIPPDIKDKDLIIIDVAYKKEIIEGIISEAKSVVFIDHHISIKDDIEKLKEKYNNVKIIYDEEECGSSLAWKYFNARQEMPKFLEYVKDQDLGKWEIKETRRFLYALKTYFHLSTESKSLNKWFRLLREDDMKKLMKKGRYMEKFMNHLINVNMPNHSLESFPSKLIYDANPELYTKVGQYRVALYCGQNCPSSSDLGFYALKKIDCDMCMFWIYNLDTKKYILSIRSNKDTDVSKIAKSLGGGGHKQASSFSFYESQYSINDIFEGKSLQRKYKEN